MFHDDHFLAKQLPLNAKLESLTELDIYVQTFSLTGKVFVETSEEEIYLWGYRRKQALKRDLDGVGLKTRITAYTEVINSDLLKCTNSNLKWKTILFNGIS